MSHSFKKARGAVLASFLALGLAAPVSIGLSVVAPEQAQAASLKKLDSVKGLSKGKSLKKLKKGGKLSSLKSGGKLKGKSGKSLLSGKSTSSLKKKLSKYIDLGDSDTSFGSGSIGGSDGLSRDSLSSKASKWKSRARDFARSLDF